jgi:hypothetical protein
MIDLKWNATLVRLKVSHKGTPGKVGGGSNRGSGGCKEGIDIGLSANENAVKQHPQDAGGVSLCVLKSKGSSPGASAQDHAAHSARHAQLLDVVQKVRCVVVPQQTGRLGPAATPLIEEDQAPVRGIKEAPKHRESHAAWSAVQEEDGCPGR